MPACQGWEVFWKTYWFRGHGGQWSKGCWPSSWSFRQFSWLIYTGLSAFGVSLSGCSWTKPHQWHTVHHPSRRKNKSYCSVSSTPDFVLGRTSRSGHLHCAKLADGLSKHQHLNLRNGPFSRRYLMRCICRGCGSVGTRDLTTN